jgi:hypothetical protein
MWWRSGLKKNALSFPPKKNLMFSVKVARGEMLCRMGFIEHMHGEKYHGKKV